MVDFTKLMKAPAGVAKAPPALPIMVAPGILKSFELIDYSTDPSKDYDTVVRFHVGLTGWPDNIPEAERLHEAAPGEFTAIDLSKKRLRRDYYDTSIYLLDEMLRSINIEPMGRSYEEVLPEAVGARVNVEVGQYHNGRTNKIENQVNRVYGDNT